MGGGREGREGLSHDQAIFSWPGASDWSRTSSSCLSRSRSGIRDHHWIWTHTKTFLKFCDFVVTIPVGARTYCGSWFLAFIVAVGAEDVESVKSENWPHLGDAKSYMRV